MGTRDDEDGFEPKVGPPKSRGRAQPSKFISRVVKQTSRAGGLVARSLKGSRPRASKRKNFGRGQVAAQLLANSLGPRSRRVAIKVRTVNLRKASARSTELHLRYIEREGVTRDGGRGHLFGANTDVADRHEFEQRSADDRHQFRVIVSPEEGQDLDDLRGFARDLIAQMERDLGTKLDWVGIDHWDTDKPHIHLAIRGKDENGRDLVIAPDYIAHGIRARASELATSWLGPRTELEIRESLTKEVTQERWTSLDRTIQGQAPNNQIVVREMSSKADERFRTGLVIGRLDHLARMGLATKTAPLTYSLAPNLESTLRAMAERGDIIRTMQRAMGRDIREHVIFDHMSIGARVIGRVADVGLADEISDRGYLVVDGIDGKAHYVALPERLNFTEFPNDMIVEVRGGADPRRSDRTIHSVAEDGIYRTQRHLALAHQQDHKGLDPQAYVQAHVRRLEALRRAGVVERTGEGVWRIPDNFMERARAYDAGRAGGATITVRSHLSIDQQVRAIGATWLDQQLGASWPVLAPHGFGAKVRSALQARADVLIQRGLAQYQGQRLIVARNLVRTLREKEIEEVARRIEAETGLHHKPVIDGQRVSGTYSRSLTLASGRFAMLDDGNGFALVPWRPAIESRLGRSMSATVRGDFVSFEFGRTRGPAR